MTCGGKSLRIYLMAGTVPATACLGRGRQVAFRPLPGDHDKKFRLKDCDFYIGDDILAVVEKI